MSDIAEDFNPTKIKQQIAEHVLTTEDKNEIIKKAWVERMSEAKPLPVDLYDKYTEWVKSNISQAQQMVQQVAQEQQAASANKGAK